MQERFENFTVLITKINRLIHKIKAEEMTEFDLKSPHVSCLYYLFKAERLTASELKDVCAEDKASISRSVEFLERNGYIECRSDAKKRYNAELTLTEKGKEVGRAIAKKIDAVLLCTAEEISENERKIMYKSLRVVLESLEKYCAKYKS
ncbi:MAG: transcriptional regulator [Clostridia bacterium]|nr:transcriptional regulator [Clostridia bacterium]